jgi:hypothetical protein
VRPPRKLLRGGICVERRAKAGGRHAPDVLSPDKANVVGGAMKALDEPLRITGGVGWFAGAAHKAPPDAPSAHEDVTLELGGDPDANPLGG